MSHTERQNEKNKLFSEFPRPLKADWETVVLHDLDGGDFEKKLVWKTDEGFDVQPMYMREDNSGLAHLGFYPGEAPFIRGSVSVNDSARPWIISQGVSAPDPVDANAEVLRAFNSGQTGARFQFDEACRKALVDGTWPASVAVNGISVLSLEDYRTLLRDIVTTEYSIELHGGMSSLALFSMGVVTGAVPAHVDFDPLSTLVSEGALPFSLDACTSYLADAIRFCDANSIAATLFTASGDCFHNAGATAVQEVALTLAAAVEYLNRLNDHGISPELAARYLHFSFSVGTNFFMEIAKLRASRALWAKILKHFGVQDEKITPMRTHVRTSLRYQTTYDPWVNMLRGTVESMAAALGGANAIRTAPFDETVGEAGEFSKRVSRNIQLVLQEEAHLGQIADPAAGSYYIEQLTGSVAQHAWTMFRSIEKNGGFFAELASGSIQDGIAATAEKKRKNLALRRDILIGTNQYPNPTEQPLADVSTNEDTVHRLQALAARSYSERSRVPLSLEGNTFEAMQRAFTAGATLRDVLEALGTDSSAEKVSPIPQYRAAAGFEKLRQAVAASTQKPIVFLAPLGPVFWRKARATFASGFFGTAGLRVIDHPGFESAESAVNAAFDAGADILVVCSDDDSYPVMVPEILELVRQADSAMQVVVAGYPKDSIQQLENAGVAEFIHVKADVEATLASMFRTFGLQVD